VNSGKEKRNITYVQTAEGSSATAGMLARAETSAATEVPKTDHFLRKFAKNPCQKRTKITFF
jgi:hypothetical protein